MPKTKNTYSQNGQVLLAVVVAVTVALAVGVSISTRTLSMSSRVSRADTSSRLVAAVEGGAERFLKMDDCALEDFVNGGYIARCDDLPGVTVNDDGDACVVAYDAEGIDAIDTKAVVTVERFRYTDDAQTYYGFALDKNQLKEIPLYDRSSGNAYSSNSITLCWDNRDIAPYYIAYDREGGFTRGGFYANGFSPDGYSPVGVLIDFDSANTVSIDDFSYCGQIDLSELNSNNKYGLRIKSLYRGGKFGVYPSGSADLPYQGYEITSIGKLSEEAEEEQTVKIVKVYRSYPYLPDVMDFAVFTNSDF